MNIWHHGLLGAVVVSFLLLPAPVSRAEDRMAADEAEILRSGSLPGYWMERCLVAEDKGLLLTFAANPDDLGSSQNPQLNPTGVGKLVCLRRNQGEWLAAPAESVAYRVQDLVLNMDTAVTVGLEPDKGSKNAVILVGRQAGESRILWKSKLRTEVLEPYKASAVALSGGGVLVIVNGAPAGAINARNGGDAALLVKLAKDGSELWQHRVVSDGAVYVNHVGLVEGKLRITGGGSGQTFERWNGLNPKMARTWGFDAAFDPDSGQALELRQVLSTQTATIRRALRFAEGGAMLTGGNFSGTLLDVIPAVANDGRVSSAFILASRGSDGQMHIVSPPDGQERLIDLLTVGGRCYALFLQIDSRVPLDHGGPKLSSRRLILRAYSSEGSLVGERECASSQFGWFKGGIMLVEYEKWLIIGLNSEAACQVLGKHFDSRPKAGNYFVLRIPPFPVEPIKRANP